MEGGGQGPHVWGRHRLFWVGAPGSWWSSVGTVPSQHVGVGGYRGSCSSLWHTAMPHGWLSHGHAETWLPACPQAHFPCRETEGEKPGTAVCKATGLQGVAGATAASHPCPCSTSRPPTLRCIHSDCFLSSTQALFFFFFKYK